MKNLDEILRMCTACVNPSKNCEECNETKRCDFYFSVIWSSVLEYFLPKNESYIR